MCFNLQIYTFFRIPATFNFFFKFSSFHPLFLPLIHPLFHPFVRRDKVVNDGNILNPFWFSIDSVLTKY